jgi:hypothetical protein
MNKLNSLVFVFLFVLFSTKSFAQEPDPIRQFVDDVNAAWVNTNYTQLLQVIDNRLAQNPNDLLALCTKQSYYLNCDFDVTQAQATVHAITNSIQQSGFTNLFPLVEEKNNLVLSIPTNFVASYTPEKIAILHQEFDDMLPGLIEAVDVALKYERLSLTNSP